jgi:RNA polymerase sigma-70 factor (ECF subfamily)
LIDPEVIEECKRGNPGSFGKLIEAISPFAFSVAYRMIGNEEDAKDIVQDAMVVIYQKIEKLKSPDRFKIWAYKIVLNKCYDKLRSRKRTNEFSPDEKTWETIANITSSADISEMEYRETVHIIEVLTERLSPVQKAVFILGNLEGLDNAEISGITGMSSRNVKASLYYARKKMCGMIKNHMK